VTAAATTGAIHWLFEKVIEKRLSFVYDQKLETHKAKLQAEHNVAIEKIRADNANLASMQAVATGAQVGAHAAAHERRLEAIATLWKSQLQLRNDRPMAALLCEIYENSGDALRAFRENPYGIEAMKRLDLQYLVDWHKSATKPVEAVRPFLGDKLFQLFHAYYFLPGRVAVILKFAVEEGKIPNWKLEADVQNVVRAVLTPEDVNAFTANKLPLMFFSTRVEALMLDEAARVISGKEAGTTALGASNEIALAIAESNAKSEKAIADTKKF
jgi:hypothetical protein